jgi:hypothetical protein
MIIESIDRIQRKPDSERYDPLHFKVLSSFSVKAIRCDVVNQIVQALDVIPAYFSLGLERPYIGARIKVTHIQVDRFDDLNGKRFNVTK